MRFSFSKYLITALLLLSAACTLRGQEAFSFVQMCDPQLGMGGYEHDVEGFEQAVQQINNLDCDFVIICGDLVHHASDSTFTDFLRIKVGLNKPCYLVPGNHDVGNVPNDSTLAFYRTSMGADYYDFQHKGASFIVSNSLLWKNDVGKESKQHDRWFNKTLRKQGRKGDPLFVIGHFPLYLEQPDEEEAYFNFPPDLRSEMLELFHEHKVEAYLSGHTHRLVINQHKGIQLVSGESTSKNFDNRPMGFRLWEISPDTIRHHFVALEH